jgi:bifunctional non-homologous end joining protein LigD
MAQPPTDRFLLDCRGAGPSAVTLMQHRRRGGVLRRDGRPSFDRIRYRRQDASVFLYAFDLIELNGDDLRRELLEVRKTTLASVLTKAGPGLRINEHLEHDDGEVVFRHACKLGLEGIVSKRKDSPYRSGPPDWLKMKNPKAAAVKREAEEDWGRSRLCRTSHWNTLGVPALP